MGRWDKVDWTKQNCQIARELGVTGERVRQKRLQLRQPKSPCHRGHPSSLKPEQKALLGTDTDPAVAKRLGVSYYMVWSNRRRLQIPAVPVHQPKWTPQALAALGKMSDRALGAKFGIATMVVNLMRRMLRIPTRTQAEGHYRRWREYRRKAA